MLRPFPASVLALGLLALAPSLASGSPESFGGVAVEPGDSRIRVEMAQGGKIPRPAPSPSPSPSGLNKQWRLPDRRGPSQEPASARGYADGYRYGLDDGRDRDRYDPVGHGNYRSADPGYYREYGSKEAYRNNYRAGFRQGYENGYRDGSRGGR